MKHDILTIKDNTKKILQLLQGKEEGKAKTNIESKIQSLDKTKEIKNNAYVSSIAELTSLRRATGDVDGYLTLFAVDYEL